MVPPAVKSFTPSAALSVTIGSKAVGSLRLPHQSHVICPETIAPGSDEVPSWKDAPESSKSGSVLPVMPLTRARNRELPGVPGAMTSPARTNLPALHVFVSYPVFFTIRQPSG